MDTAMLIEIFGYIGSALVVVSMLMSSIVKLRVVNTVGSIVSGIYALIVGAFPLVLMNGCLIVINLYNLFKLLKTKQVYDLVDGNADDAFVAYFLERYADNIKACFPGFKKEDACGKKAYIVCCDGNPAGVLVGDEKDGEIDMLIDYSTPSYRDCSVGTYLYSQLPAKNIKKLVYAQNKTELHVSYMNKMGFVQENDAYVKKFNE